MKNNNKASLRRKRVIAVTEAGAKKQSVSLPRRRRRITSKARDSFTQNEVDYWGVSPNEGFMGKLLCQPVYSFRYTVGCKLKMPFAENQPFTCLINAAKNIKSEDFEHLALFLLNNNMRYVVCTGIEADRLADVLNEILFDGSFHQEGRTAVVTSHEDDPIEEVMEYFALPSGMAPVSLIVSIGNKRTFKTMLEIFSTVSKRMKVALSC